MKIIISAYDCSPDHGSEAGLGWNWVMAASKYADFDKVHVITTDRYEKNIKRYVAEHSDEMKKIQFHFLPLPLSGIRKLNQRFKYIIWQWRVGKLAKDLCERENISFLHHVTWATCVLPTFLYRGGAPMVYGPIGGGERIPKGVDIKISKRDAFVEWVRNCVADISVHIPINKRAYKNAALILSTTEETKKLIPSRFHNKVRIMQAIGINELPELRQEVKSGRDEFIVLLAARMLCWKGIDIAIEAFRKLENQDKNISLIIAGTGRNLEHYKNMASELGNVKFLGEVPHSQMQKIYQEADILLNCSLHDSGCMVVLEAMSFGLPIIAIRTGGPAIIADNNCAVMIEPKTISQMVNEICQNIIVLKKNATQRKLMGENSIERTSEFLYEKKYGQIIRNLKEQGNFSID